MAGDAVGQLQEGAQPRLLGVAEKLHVLEALGPAEQRAEGEDQQVFKLVQPGALDARVGNFAQEVEEVGAAGGGGYGIGHPELVSGTPPKVHF